MDRLNAMSLLLTAVEAGSLSAAARRLGVPLTTVSRRIADLEAHLKTRLLVRAARRLTLTEAGLAYVAAIKPILEQVGEAERAAAGEYSAPRGDLVVAAPVVFGRFHVTPVAVDFLTAYPEIDLRLVLADRIAHLAEERIDAAVRIGPLPDSSLIATRLGQVQRGLFASPDYLAAQGWPKTPEALGSHACITFDGLFSANTWRFPTPRGETTVRVRSRLAVNTAEAALDAAVAGLGVTGVFCYQAAKAVQDGELIQILQDFDPAPWPVHLVHTGQGLIPQKLRAFLDFATPRLRERLALVDLMKRSRV